MNHLSQSKNLTMFIVSAAAWVGIGLLPKVQAVGPDTEGSIPGSNNGEGIGVLVSRTNGVWNTGTGLEALNHLTSGNQNTATGLRALFSDINGGFNTATGVYSLFSNTTGFFNGATGAYSLAHNTIGNRNTANGYSALYFNTEGEQNTATGYAALYRNTTGEANTAVGTAALFNNREGTANTATGLGVLLANTTGMGNTATGASALGGNTTGDDNTAIGNLAGANQSTGSGNVYIGTGMLGVAGESNACYIRSIFGQTSASGIAVVINSNNKLGTTTSSKRFKEEIKAMDKASEALLALKPVTFRYKKDIDPAGTLQFGLAAEDVEKVNPELVVRDQEGKPYSVRYDQVNAMLLNEFLKEQRKVEKLEATVASLVATMKGQAAQMQKVSEQLEASKPAPQMVNNP
jgi:trimeric autotransporter adhesin